MASNTHLSSIPTKTRIQEILEDEACYECGHHRIFVYLCSDGVYRCKDCKRDWEMGVL